MSRQTRRDRHSLVFHGFIAVAPLEASKGPSPRKVGLRLPRLHRRGPIEASALANKASNRWGLPRLHRRGPIEALRCAAPHSGGMVVFHGFIAVAPLKQVAEVQVDQLELGLPRLHRRGPIEAGMGSILR